MSISYSKTNWQDSPSTATPLNAANLNKIENGIEAAVNGINELDSGKLSSAAGAVKTANIDTGAVTEAKLATALKNTLYRMDTETQNVGFSGSNPKTIYLNAAINDSSTFNGQRGIIITSADNSFQFFFGRNKLLLARYKSGENTYSPWEDVHQSFEKSSNKKTAINSSNQASTAFFPSIKAVVDYIAALFATVINNDNKSSNALLPTIKAVVDYLTANYTDTTALNSALSGKMDAAYAEDIRYKIEEFGDTAPDPDDEEYPSAIAVWNYVEGAFSTLSTKHSQNSAKISDLQAYLGYTSPDILGLCVDLENSRFTRLAGAFGKTAGSDFDAFPMFGGRRRCCVANDGTINAYYGEQGYAEDGTNGQVMVYQPKFYYRMVPLKLEKQASGLGYHIRKANYYVTANPRPGFKLHPLFYDANGKELDYVLLSAYEGSMYDVSESAYVNDGVDNISYASGDLLCSVSGKKPISGKLTTVGTRANFEDMAQTRGTGWHLDTIQSVSANQLLMMIELGTLNVQSAVGNGVVTVSDNDNYNCASLTGATASLGNATGMASTTIGESAGTETTETTNGKLSVSYRGVENPWGNIWKYINGLNLWGNGSMNGGQAYICSDFTFSDSDRTQHYQPSGFTVSNSNGYASAFGYGDEAYDWLMIPSECTGSSIEPVGDQSYFKPNLNEFNIARFGGSWNSNMNGGAYCWGFVYAPGFRYYFLGGRLLYVPTA